MLLRWYLALKNLPKRLAIASGPVLRLVAALLLLTAVIALVADWVHQRPWTSSADYWQNLSPASYANAGKLVSRALGEWVWNPLIGALLALPAYVLLGALALALGYAGRRRRRVNVYVN